MKSLIFPDVNVWLAISHSKHEHHRSAINWFTALDPNSVLIFSRHTQLALFRLLSNESIFPSEALTQAQCWAVYDKWIDAREAILADEPPEMEVRMRKRTSMNAVSTKTWADAYLAAFAETANLTLVTFDRALAGKTQGSILLQ